MIWIQKDGRKARLSTLLIIPSSGDSSGETQVGEVDALIIQENRSVPTDDAYPVSFAFLSMTLSSSGMGGGTAAPVILHTAGTNPYRYSARRRLVLSVSG